MSAIAISPPLEARAVKGCADFIDIASRYTWLRRAGRQYVGLCPFHSECHASFYVHPEKKVFWCFGCGAGGDLFNFIMRAEDCDFPGALQIVADFSSGVARESGPRSGPRLRAGVGAAPGAAKRPPMHSPIEPRPRAISGACSWPSLECRAERAFFT